MIIINIICSILLLFIGILAWKHEGVIYNPLTAYSILWSLVVFLAGFQLYGMKNYESITIVIIFGGVLAYALGWFINDKIIITCNNNIEYVYTIRRSVVYIILLIAMLVYISLSVKVFVLLLQGYDYGYIRSLHQGYVGKEYFDSSLILVLNTTVLAPSINAIFIITIIDGIQKKWNIKMLILVCADILLYAFSTAGRFIFINCIITVFVTLLIYKIKINNKLKRKIRGIIIFLVLLVVLITVYRGIESSTGLDNIFTTIYIYLTGTIPLFDFWRKEIGEFKAYGTVFFYGVLDICDSLIKYSGLGEWDVLKEVTPYIKNTERFIKVFNNTSFNAFVSIFYYFYLDFGIIGVIFGDFLYGFFSKAIFKRISRKNNFICICFLIILLQQIIQTLIRWPFAYMTSLFVWIYIIVYVKKEKVKRELKYGYLY